MGARRPGEIVSTCLQPQPRDLAEEAGPLLEIALRATLAAGTEVVGNLDGPAPPAADQHLEQELEPVGVDGLAVDHGAVECEEPTQRVGDAPRLRDRHTGDPSRDPRGHATPRWPQALAAGA